MYVCVLVRHVSNSRQSVSQIQVGLELWTVNKCIKTASVCGALLWTLGLLCAARTRQLLRPGISLSAFSYCSFCSTKVLSGLKFKMPDSEMSVTHVLYKPQIFSISEKLIRC